MDHGLYEERPPGELLESDVNAPASEPSESPGVTFDSAREIPRDSARRTTLNDPDALDDPGALILCVERRFRFFDGLLDRSQGECLGRVLPGFKRHPVALDGSRWLPMTPTA